MLHLLEDLFPVLLHYLLDLLLLLVVISVKTHFSDQVKVRDTSQLIKGMSKVLQNLLKYSNGTTISSFCISLLGIFVAFLICIWCFSCNTTFVFKRLRICYGVCIVINSRRVMIIKKRIIRLISVIIPQTTCCFLCNVYYIQANCTLVLQYLDLLHCQLMQYWSLICN